MRARHVVYKKKLDGGDAVGVSLSLFGSPQRRRNPDVSVLWGSHAGEACIAAISMVPAFFFFNFASGTQFRYT